MKKRRIILAVFVSLIVVISALIWWQSNNIKMAYYSYKYDNTQIDTEIRQRNEEVDTYLKENGNYNVRPSTDAEQKLHQAKLLTDDEFVNILTGKTDVKTIFGFDIAYDESKGFVNPNGDKLNKDELARIKKERKAISGPDSLSQEDDYTKASTDKTSSDKNSQGTSKNNLGASVSSSDTSKAESGKPSGGDGSGNVSDSPLNSTNGQDGVSGSDDKNPVSVDSQTSSDNEKASEYIAQMYVLKSSFESQLDGLYSEAKAYYSQLVSEKKGNVKSEMVKKFYSQATSLEAQCDQSVETVLSELTSVLKSSGQDVTIVDKIRSMYREEKSLKKAYYLNLAK